MRPADLYCRGLRLYYQLRDVLAGAEDLRQVCWSVGRSAGQLGRSVGLVGRQVCWSVGRSVVCWSVGLVSRSAGQLGR